MFEAFAAKVKDIIEAKAEAKGYRKGQASNPGGELYAFVKAHFGGHDLGEAVYKLVRFAAKGDEEDLLKAAAWIYLTWANLPREVDISSPPPTRSGYVPKLEFAPTEIPALAHIHEFARLAAKEALEQLEKRPAVREADEVRLGALVVEEASEALTEALDHSRNIGTLAHYGDFHIHRMEDELIQTAAMAAISWTVLQGRR